MKQRYTQVVACVGMAAALAVVGQARSQQRPAALSSIDGATRTVVIDGAIDHMKRTYNLKNLERAIIVGETSGGGAHPGGVRRITDHFGIWLPNGRAINPITKTNWEGTGIEPHVKVPAPEALGAAHMDALRKVRAAATDPRHGAQLDAAIAALEKTRGSGSK